MGVGYAGVTILESLDEDDDTRLNTRYVVAHTDAELFTSLTVPMNFEYLKFKTFGLAPDDSPAFGAAVAEKNRKLLEECLKGVSLLVLVGGLGGNIASGACPVIARMARKKGITVIAVVTFPYSFEDKKRTTIAQKACKSLAAEAHVLVVIDNDCVALPPELQGIIWDMLIDPTLVHSVVSSGIRDARIEEQGAMHTYATALMDFYEEAHHLLQISASTLHTIGFYEEAHRILQSNAFTLHIDVADCSGTLTEELRALFSDLATRRPELTPPILTPRPGRVTASIVARLHATPKSGMVDTHLNDFIFEEEDDDEEAEVPAFHRSQKPHTPRKATVIKFPGMYAKSPSEAKKDGDR